MMRGSKQLFAVGAAMVLFVAVAGLGTILLEKRSGNDPVFCPQDAKVCPDGSYVGREGPNCEFMACPQESAEGKFCGGIAAFPCPQGYECRLDGDYPDAGGKCVMQSSVSCAKDAKLCSDGSVVGRLGPACEFSVCPGGMTHEKIKITMPEINDIITTPLEIAGEARGSWYFEAVFPIVLLDNAGTEIARTSARAQGDWMTEDFVPFSARLEFTRPAGETGAVVLQKDNPSGLSEHDESLVIPIRFK